MKKWIAVLAAVLLLPAIAGAGVVCSSTNKSCGSSGGGSGGPVSFNTVTSGTNTTAAMVVGTGASLATSGSGTIAATSAAATHVTIANEGVTGTTANYLAKLTGAPSTAVLAATTDTQGIVGVVVSGAGTTGSATIARSGSASCVFDGATTAGDYVQISATAAGKCHDTGSATYPASGQVLGRVLSTNGAGGTYAMTLHMGTQGDLHPLTSDGTNVTLGSGQLLLPAGTAALPPLSFTGFPTTGIVPGTNKLTFSIATNDKLTLNLTALFPSASAGLALGATGARWSAGYFGGQTLTTTVTPLWDGAVTWNDSGTSHRLIYGNVTDTASAAASTLIDLQVASASKFSVSKAGFGLFASSVQAGGGTVYLASSSALSSAGTGIITAFNFAQNDFNRLQLGGTTSSFPAIKRDGAALANVFADGTGPLTTATMTAEHPGILATTTSSYTWTNAMVVALGASLTGDIKVATLPAKTQVVDAAVVITGTAAGTTTLTVACGRTSAAYIDYIVASDAQAAANTVYGDASAERGTNLTGYDLPSYTGTTDVYCHFISTGANLSAVTGSTGRVTLTTRLMP